MPGMPDPAGSLIEDYAKQFSLDGSGRFGKQADTGLWRPAFFFLLSVDVLFSFFLIGPSVVAIWRCVWELPVHLLGEHGHDEWVNAAALGAGLLVTFIIDLLHPCMKKGGGKPGSLKFAVLSKCFSSAWAVFDILLWKGLWDGLDEKAGKHWITASSSLAIGVTFLSATRCLKSALSVPVGISVDVPSEHILASTYFQANKDDTFLRRLCDSVVSRLLEICVVLTWHGIWTLLDIFTYEKIEWTFYETTLLSFLLGITGTLSIALIQLPLVSLAPTPRTKCPHQNGNKKEANNIKSNGGSTVGYVCWLLSNYVFTLFGVFVTISSFRSFWYFMDLYFLPQYLIIKFLLPAIIGWLVLCSSGCMTCLHAGIFKDDPSLGVTIPFYYFSHKYVQNCSPQTNPNDQD